MSESNKRGLTPYLSPAGAWTYALGTSIGWGSLVVTSNTYLVQAGPLGSVLGLLVGAIVMLFIGRNYHYMMNRFPESGGAYAYVRNVFGFDRGFLTAWFIALTYLAMLWANTTSLPLFARYFIGDFFKFGRLYHLFGYDVYVGEALLSIGGLLLVSLLGTRRRNATVRLMVALAVLLTAGILVCFIAAMLGHKQSFDPAYVPDSAALSQILKIAAISPWAFIGFENISHAVPEFKFPVKKSFRVLTVAVLTATALYIGVFLLSVSAYPDRYASWLDYIRDLGNLSGLEGLPPFYAAQRYLGSFGVWTLMVTLLALVVTSLIGNVMALSRLFCAMADDNILPARFASVNEAGSPDRAIMLILLLSLPIPFLGRTAIGWIVDVTTLGATLIYGFVSAATMKQAAFQKDRLERFTGAVGLVAMVAVGAYLLLPNLFTTGSLEPESYFLFVVWSILGLICFHWVIRRDSEHRFGRAITVWIALLALLLFVSLVWVNQSTVRATREAMTNMQEYYHAAGLNGSEAVIASELSHIQRTSARSIVVVIVMFMVALGVLLNNYSLLSRRALASENALTAARNLANTDALTGVKSKHAYVEWEKSLNAQIGERDAPPFSIVVCDVNGLKFINDTQGHKVGDDYIRAASRIICEIYQHSPVFRIGGDEFVVLLTGSDYDIRQELLDALKGRSSEESVGQNRVVIAVGMSDYSPQWDTAVHEIFDRADALMYQNKQQLKAIGVVSR